MNYQVTIVGGGVAGALLALYLGKARVNTCLIDKGKPSLKLANPFVGRTTSLNLSSINSLREAGIWETIEKNSQQFEEIYVWDAEGSSSVQFNAAEISRKDLGVIVHNNIILEAKDISKYFGTITALKSANLSLKPGEVLGVVGDNGAGKTTLMKGLVWLYKPS